MLTENEIYNFSVYHNAQTLLADFAVLKRIAESDIREILEIKKRDISITSILVSFCSCGDEIEVDKIKLINGNVYLSGKFPSGKEVNKPFSEIWDIHDFADICKEIGV